MLGGGTVFANDFQGAESSTFSLFNWIVLIVFLIGTTILGPGLLNTEIWDAARARPDRFGGARNRDPAIAARWREAKSPDLMSPHVIRTIEAGGGYITCPTYGGETARIFRERADEIAAGIVEI